jgi:hypothetical protein
VIPGFIISWVTFPGVIVHEIAHQLFCRLFGVKVLHVCYFRFGNPCGFVWHAPARKHWHSVMISIGPFFVNSILGFLIGTPSFLRLSWGGLDPLDLLMVWLGVSIAMHSFPSIGDANNIWDIVRSKETPWFTRLVGLPIVGILCLGAAGSVFWLDFLYGIGLVSLAPWLIVKFIA